MTNDTMTHATRSGYALCHTARGGTTFGSVFMRYAEGTDAATCSDCRAIIAFGGSGGLPKPEPVAEHPVHSTLLAEMQRQIKVKYRLKYGINLDDPDWAVEDYRPLRNRR